MKTMYFGGGCFWCTEAVFKSIHGVTTVVPGYMGGTVPNPSYESVCSGTTGHAEVVQVEYDPHIVTLPDLLDIFFETHDPTTLNRQGNDVGTQYRSVIFYTEDEQRTRIEDAISRAREKYAGKTMVTEIAQAREFYPAENYHYDYYAQHKTQPYCQLVISPKLEKLHKKFEDKLKI